MKLSIFIRLCATLGVVLRAALASQQQGTGVGGGTYGEGYQQQQLQHLQHQQVQQQPAEETSRMLSPQQQAERARQILQQQQLQQQRGPAPQQPSPYTYNQYSPPPPQPLPTLPSTSTSPTMQRPPLPPSAMGGYPSAYGGRSGKQTCNHKCKFLEGFCNVHSFQKNFCFA